MYAVIRFSRLIPMMLILTVLLLSCGKSGDRPFDGAPLFSSFRDIPGVTGDEITKIQALQKQYDSFVYGMTPGTESFVVNGNIGGFSAFVCEWLTGLFDIPFVPALYEWGDLITGLKAGEIDFSGDLTPSDERRNTYFMTDAIAQRTIKYFRIKDNAPLAKIAQERPLRFGFLEGSVVIDRVISFNEYEMAEPVFIRDYESAYELLNSGRVDAFLQENIAEAAFDIYGDVIVEDFFPMIYSPVSLTTQNPELEPVISVVQKALRNDGPRHLSWMYSRGQREYSKYKLFLRLSEEEKAYIHMNPVVLFAPEHDNYPLCFFNAQEKQWQGIAFEVMDEVQALTGLTFKIVSDQKIAWPVMVKMLEDGQVSMLTELVQSEERKGRFIWPSTAIITDNYALLSKSEFKNISIGEILYVRVGLPKGTAYTELFKEWFPDHEYTTEYESSDAAFQALDRGEVDMVMSSQYRFLLLTNYRELPGYKANVVFDYTFVSTFGFNRNEEILCSVVDKALALIDTKKISDQWMRKTYDYREKLMRARVPVLICVPLIVLVLFFMLVIFQRNRNESRRLEKLVQQRTAEFHKSQQDLQAALEAAKAANSSKSVFLANMSHEIRTPMNSIVGFSELALDGEVSPKTRDYLNKIQENADWLLQIINDILDISKIESGKMDLEHIPFDMHELFASCRTLIMPKAIEKGVMLHFYAEPSVGQRPLGDPTRLRQILVNLLSNSVKFTNTGMIKLHAAVKEKTNKTLSMHFEVKDSGIGMTTEQIDRIFDPFMQAETGTTRKYGGTGLGLSITKNIVELMGGELSVTSTPGVGSKFSFDLTFDTIDVADDELFSTKIVFNEIEKPVFEGEVLLCEDNAMNQQVICEHLVRVGLKPFVADNGKIGVEMVQRRREMGEKQFDLVFMDMHMPVMDGLEASAKILELHTGIPIVAMTANIMSNDREIYRMSGMSDCVGKPFTSQELWRCLIKYFKPISGGTLIKKEPNESAVTVESDAEFQRTLQRMFLRNNRQKFEEITNALEANDIKLAHRLAHTLKSNSGQIGRTLLQKAAADVEYHLKDGKNMVSAEHLGILEAELKSTLSQLDAELGPDGEKSPSETAVQSEPLDAQAARELFDKLEPMLKMGNPDCCNYINDLRRISESETLIQQMEDFDFELAVATLAELKKKV